MSPDPTQAANAINLCCEGRSDSRFCVESCLGIIGGGDLLNELIPNCVDIVFNELVEPTCVGSCPEIVEAIHIPVTTDVPWRPRSFDVHADGSIAMHAMVNAGTIDFGNGAMATVASPTQFVTVFEADGSARWLRTLSSGHPDAFSTFGQLAKFDDAGNVVATGELHTTVDLGSGDLTPVGGADILVAKWSRDGALLWARSFGSSGSDLAHGVEADGSETVFLAEFADTIDLGEGAHLNAGAADILVARLDAAGDLLGSRAHGGPDIDIPWTLAIHEGGEYTIGGGVSTGADFGDGPITSAGDQDSFIARFAADGTLRWQHIYGGPTWDIAYQMDSHADTSVVADYLSSGRIDVGGESIEGPNQPLIRMEADGSVGWVNDNPVAGEVGGFAVLGVSASDAGIFVSATSGTAQANLGGGAHEAFSSTDMIPASYALDGSYRWSMRLGGPLTEDLSYFTSLSSGGSIFIGVMIDQIDYGPGDLVGEGRDLFILRFAD